VYHFRTFISQTIIPPSGGQGVTWYVRDAQGNLLSTYIANGTSTDLADLTLNLSEQYMYGSSRLGLFSSGINGQSVDGGPDAMEGYRRFSYNRGFKQYELTNHLGNVLATISDRKLA